MKKILFIAHQANLVGGADDDLERLLKFISENKLFGIDLLSPAGPRLEEFKKYVNRIFNYRFGYLPGIASPIHNYVKYFVKLIIQLFQIFSKVNFKNYDICIINVSVLAFTALFIKIFNKNLKIVFFVREMILPEFLRKVVLKIINRISYGSVFVSSGLKNDYCKINSNSKNLLVLYSASEPPEDFYDIQAEAEVELFLNANSINDHRPIIVNIGPISPIKNQKLIVKAISQLKKINSDINPVLIHIGHIDREYTYTKELLEFLEETGLSQSCFFLGIKNKKITHTFIKRCYAVIISSVTEGMPLVVSEAFMHRKLLITTECLSNEKILISDFNCIIVKNNPDELANSLLKSVLDRQYYSSITDNGFKTYEEFLDLNKNLEKFSKYLQSIN